MGTVTYRRTAAGIIKLENQETKFLTVFERNVQPVPCKVVTDRVQTTGRCLSSFLGAAAGLTYPLVVSASTGDAGDAVGGIHLIQLLQRGAFYAGMGVTIWGIVEAMLGFPGWRARVAKGVLGYVGILLVPLVFMEIQDALQVRVWHRLEGGRP